MRLQFDRLVDYLRESLWFIPALGIATAIALELLLVELDERFLSESTAWFVFGGGPDSARSFLSTIAASLLSMAVLVFSVTMLVLQLASSQLSPRVMGTFLGDRQNQTVLGLFISTFTYALLALRDVRDDFVPGLTVWVAFFGALASVGAFVYFLDHMAHSIRAATVIERIGNDTRHVIDRVFTDSIEEAADGVPFEPSRPPDLVAHHRGHAGVLTGVDEESLVALAEDHEAMVAVVPKIGEFVASGSVIALVWGDIGDADGALNAAVLTAGERSLREDPAFGFRQLVDIAERALSPGTNDPTTAVQVLNQLHDLLLRVAWRALPSPVYTDDSGRPCLYVPMRNWDDYVGLAFDEIRQYGAGSEQVVLRLNRMIEDLIRDVPPRRRPALQRQKELLGEAVTQQLSEPEQAAVQDAIERQTAAALARYTNEEHRAPAPGRASGD